MKYLNIVIGAQKVLQKMYLIKGIVVNVVCGQVKFIRYFEINLENFGILLCYCSHSI